MRRLVSLFSGMVLLAAAAVPISAAAFDTADPQSMVDGLQQLGFRAVLKTAPDEKYPVIESTIEATNCVVIFYGCKEGKDCQGLQFVASFRTREPVDLARINAWNLTKILGTASVDDQGVVRIRHFVLAVGDLSEFLFGGVVGNWGGALVDFKRFIGFNPAAATAAPDTVPADQ